MKSLVFVAFCCELGHYYSFVEQGMSVQHMLLVSGHFMFASANTLSGGINAKTHSAFKSV
jgi:uncharacterized membrane protein YedE/YeeE